MNTNDLLQLGFTGGLSIDALRKGKRKLIPEAPGAYAIVRTKTTPPYFHPRSSAKPGLRGDPTVEQDVLSANWVAGAQLVYVGMAPLRPGNKGLRTRVGELLRFGEGAAENHWAGRLVWQLSDVTEALVYWKLDPDPRDTEREVLARFAALNDGQSPFANLVN